MSARAQERRQRRADQARRAGDRHDQALGARVSCVAMGGQIVGELPVPIDEHRAQRRGGHGRVDAVVHPRRPPVVATSLNSCVCVQRPTIRGGHDLGPSDESTSTNRCGGS